MRVIVRIARARVGVVCTLPEAASPVRALLAPYARARQADCWFRIDPHERGAILRVDGECLWAGEIAETIAGFEVHFYLRALALVEPHCLSLHGAWFAWGSQAVLVLADSGGGKSSLATAAVLAGACYGSDEFALVDPEGRLEPFPRPLQWGRIRHPAFPHALMRAAGLAKARLCFRDHQGKRRLNLWWLPPRIARTARTPRLVVFARWARGAPPSLDPMSRAAAMIELVRHLHHRLAPRAALRMLHARLPPETRFFQLTFGNARQAIQILRATLQAAMRAALSTEAPSRQ